MGGFEPTDHGVKVHCLTTWRHPMEYSIIGILAEQNKKNNGQGGIRTPDTVVRSHVLYPLSYTPFEIKVYDMYYIII